MIAQPDRPVNAKLLLASASPRRRELITLLGLPIEITAVDIDETPLDHEHAAAMAIRLSRAKAQAVLSSLLSLPSSLIILAADTVVSLDGEPLGKPRAADEARAMLKRLRHRTHQVYTAVTLIDRRADQTISDLATSNVPMRDYSDDEIEAYIASGDPFDKAGAYAIQHTGFHPVDRFADCFANVMGLPVCHVVRSLRKLSIEPMNNVPLHCQAHIQYECPVFERILKSEE